MLEARISWRFGSSGVDHVHILGWGSRAAGVCVGIAYPGRILRNKQIASCRRRGRSRNDELMSRKTWTLIGLEHPVGENVLLSHLKIRLNIRRLDIHELRIGRWAVRRPGRAPIVNP